MEGEARAPREAGIAAHVRGGRRQPDEGRGDDRYAAHDVAREERAARVDHGVRGCARARPLVVPTPKAETASPPRATIGAQQHVFTRFQAIYNEERPHEALGMKLPAELYDFSPRQMPAKLPEHEYASDMELRRVRTDGSIKWAGKMLFVGEALEGEVVGLRQVDDEAWSLSLGPMRLATLHERSRVLVPTSPEEVSPMCPDRSATMCQVACCQRSF